MNDLAIGVFDSGLGGLTVVDAIQKVLPTENIIYLGDTAHVPYGTKSDDSIREFSKNNTEFLLKQNVKLIVIACNSASAVALDYLSNKFPSIPIIGVIDAGVEACVKQGDTDIYITGTYATIESGVYQQKIAAISKKYNIHQKACPLFVPIVEEGLIAGSIAENIVKLYLSELCSSDVEKTLLLGCTHYPLLKDTIKSVLSPKINVLDSATCCADYTKEFLRVNNILNPQSESGRLDIYVTDRPKKFKTICSNFLGRDICSVTNISIS